MKYIKTYNTEVDFSENEPANERTWNLGPVLYHGVSNYMSASLTEEGPDEPMTFTVNAKGAVSTYEIPYSGISTGEYKALGLTQNDEVVMLDIITGATGVTEDQENDVRIEWFESVINYSALGIENLTVYVPTRKVRISDPSDVGYDGNGTMFFISPDSAFTDGILSSELFVARFINKETPINEYVTSIEPGMAYVKETERVAFNYYETPAPPEPVYAIKLKYVYGGSEQIVGSYSSLVYDTVKSETGFSSLSVSCGDVANFIRSAINDALNAGLPDWWVGNVYVEESDGTNSRMATFNVVDWNSVDIREYSDCDLADYCFCGKYKKDPEQWESCKPYYQEGYGFDPLLQGKTLLIWFFNDKNA